MKKKVLACAAFVVSTVVVASVTLVKRTDSSLILSDNVEALASEEGEGVPVKNCHIANPFSTNHSWELFCDSRTTDDMIFPCVDRESYDGSSGTTKCIAKE